MKYNQFYDQYILFLSVQLVPAEIQVAENNAEKRKETVKKGGLQRWEQICLIKSKACWKLDPVRKLEFPFYQFLSQLGTHVTNLVLLRYEFEEDLRPHGESIFRNLLQIWNSWSMRLAGLLWY